MPLTLVQRQVNQSAAAVASLTGTYAPAPTSGNLLTANVCSDATVTMTSTGWTLAVSSVSDVGLYQWYKLAGASESASVVATPSGSASTEIVIEEWSGNVASLPLDKTSSGSAGSGLTNVPSGTTAATVQADELAVAAFGWNQALANANTYTNSYAEVAETRGLGATATNVAVAEVALSSAAATSTTMTLSAVQNAVKSGLIGTYMAAAAGAAASVMPPTFNPVPFMGGHVS